MNRFFRPASGMQWIQLTLTAILAAGFLYGFSALQSIQSHQNDALRAVICFSENYVRHDPKLTPAQVKVDLQVYNEMLQVGHLAACSVPPPSPPH